MIIDAIMPLEIQGTEEHWRVVNWFVRDLNMLQEICQNQPECAKNYPDIPERLREAVRTVIDNPIEVEVNDTEVFPSGKVHLFQDVAAFLPFILFYEQDNYPVLPGLIYAWAEGLESRDEALFKTLAGAMAEDGGLGDGSPGMQLAIHCNDGGVQAQGLAAARDREEHPVLGSLFGSEEANQADLDQCYELGMPMRPAEDYAAAVTDIPTLIVEGAMDPITPPPNAHAILPGFSNGTYIEYAYAGHGPTRSVQCSGHMMNRWYDDPTQEPDMSCPESMEEPELWSPMFKTSFAPKLGALFFDDKKKLAVPGAWAGGSVVVSLVAFLMLTLAPIGRKLNGREATDVGRSRLWAWMAAASSVTAVMLLAAAVAATTEASDFAILFGLVPWAVYAAWLGVIAGVLGLVAIFSALLNKSQVPTGSKLGFVVTGLAAVGLSSFMFFWDLAPF